MVRPERDAIGDEHPVEVDECMIGGETRGEGRGIHHKSIVVGAVEVRSRQDDGKKHKRRKTRWIIGRCASALSGSVLSDDGFSLGFGDRRPLCSANLRPALFRRMGSCGVVKYA